MVVVDGQITVFEITDQFRPTTQTVLDRFGYLEFTSERVTDRGRWLADLRVDRPLLVGEALQRGLFAELDATRAAALIAALVADDLIDEGIRWIAVLV